MPPWLETWLPPGHSESVPKWLITMRPVSDLSKLGSCLQHVLLYTEQLFVRVLAGPCTLSVHGESPMCRWRRRRQARAARLANFSPFILHLI
jgi:hypothetical protein